jgi:hypothetical protein
MSASDRQNRLLVAEDWKRIYQSFRNADFQSYDFDNLRRTMINYLRQNYPEDFNDYIESSEYLALIDMIAFLGQNLSFRIDLNARENFLETAERRESILRLARMLAYNPRRNQAANGLLKITTVKTTETVRDSSGVNLSGVVVRWNDQSNSNYFEQFIKILNAALPVTNSVGNPLKSENIEGVQTQKYRINATNTTVPVFPFSKNVEGVSTRFEVVSTDFDRGVIREEPPLPGTSPAFLFRDDGQGAGSTNTGFFMHFRQGKLDNGTFNVSNPTPNQVVSIDAENINNSDVWLYAVDTNGFETIQWSKLDSVEGNNIIYNSLFQGIRNVYAVTTRIGDRINLVFSDGVFGNLPSGNFKIYYRTSANRPSVIAPGAIGNVNIEIPYQGRSGSLETLTLGLRLQTTVANGTATESNDSIKQNAPATYYTQNRLITGEDYNIGPLAVSQDIIKTKAVNRISSGISRYFDLKDVSGKYSSTSLFADDGVVYKETFDTKTQFTFSTQSDVEGIIVNVVEGIISSTNLKNFYYSEFPQIIVTDLNAAWENTTEFTNQYTGFIKDIDGTAYTLGSFTANNLRLVEAGTLMRFVPPLSQSGATQYFLPNGTYTTNSEAVGATSYKWTKVAGVTGNGAQTTETGAGAVTLVDLIPDGAILEQIIPKFSRSLSDDLKTQIIDQTFAYRDYALRYNVNTRSWTLVLAADINTVDDFATGKTGDASGQNLDSSWLLYFKTDGETYTITYRNLRYVFESAEEIRFFFDSADKVYDPKTSKILRDKITVLNINKQPDANSSFTRDFVWNISDAYRDKEGYVDTRKIQVQFFDLDDDGVIDDPDLFEKLVEPNVNSQQKIVFQQRYTTSDGVEDFRYFDNINSTVKIVTNESAIVYSREVDGQVFYLFEEGVFKTLNKSRNNTTINTNYKAFVGRSGLKFHYVHVADSNYRIDPSASNIIDTYLLTRNYDTEVRKYLAGGRATEPKPESNDQLFRNYGSAINAIKSISDEIVYHPVKYKILFGNKAKEDLQVKFKIVRNRDLVVNENELKADIIQAVDRFFAIENWDFGETFYFQELSAYIMNQLSPKLLSVIIVPRQGSQSFGSLFEIKSEPDEIFISAATVFDVEIIDELTATELQSSGTVITSVTTTTTAGIVSSATATSSNTSGGYSF